MAIEIWTIEDLDNIRLDLTEDYVLMRDLDFQDDASYNDPANKTQYLTGEGWVPIGDDDNPFEGNFDGGDFTISNLFINRVIGYDAGLFGLVIEANFSNVRLNNANISIEEYSGVLVSWSEESEYSNILISNSIINAEDNNSPAGGISSYSESDKFDNCGVINCIINGGSGAGGFVGDCRSFTINNCYVNGGEINAIQRVGGFIGGRVTGTCEINNCYNTAKVSGTLNVGGFVGHTAATIEYNNCFWDIETSNQTTSAGNAVGLTTQQMKTLSTFTDASWNIAGSSDNLNDGYPFLGFQIDKEDHDWYIYVRAPKPVKFGNKILKYNNKIVKL